METRQLCLSLTVAALLSCDTGPLTVYGRTPLESIPIGYSEWYSEAEACLGAPGSFNAIHWYVADSIYNEAGQSVFGYVDHPHDITLRRDVVEAAQPITVEHFVKHEMVHHILQRGNDLHDAEGNVPCEVAAVS